METKDGVTAIRAESRKEWRSWLEKNHKSEKSVWLIIYKKATEIPSVYYEEAVEEALCFGWIDSKGNKRDKESYYQSFAKRNPKSNWSRINKARVEKLIKADLMTSSGLEIIETAKQNGKWAALDEIEKIIIPVDLKSVFQKNKKALVNWNKFPKSSKRGILEWIMYARKPETRLNRIEETVRLAEENVKANHPKKGHK